MQKAFFIDRDGTINVDYNFVYSSEEWKWCTGTIEAIRWMNKNRFKVIVVTNQSGIVRGHFSLEQVQKLHEWVDRELEKQNAHIDDWYIAPHHPEHDSPPADFSPEDRKPGTGMFRKAAKKHDIDFNSSYMAGDKITDLKPAVKLGITPFFIRSRHERNQNKQWLADHGIETFESLYDIIRKKFKKSTEHNR
jgi:D-glycero-D-manno-heptose 1,7-bisphosphate phosphatase